MPRNILFRGVGCKAKKNKRYYEEKLAEKLGPDQTSRKGANSSRPA
jgi:hypothetical protein